MTRFKRRVLAIAVVAAGALAVPAVKADMREVTCFDRNVMVEILAKKYNEHVVDAKFLPQVGHVEVYAAQDGSWTVIYVNDGRACVIAAGVGYEMAEPEKKV